MDYLFFLAKWAETRWRPSRQEELEETKGKLLVVLVACTASVIAAAQEPPR
jgi:hypothetical protein